MSNAAFGPRDAVRLPGSGKERVDGFHHGGGGLGAPLRGGKGLDVLGVREIAEFHEDGGKLRRLQDDEARRAFWVVVELRRASQVVDEASRKDVGVGPGLPTLEIEQDVGDIRILQADRLRPGPLSAAFSRAAMRAASASEARSATV